MIREMHFLCLTFPIIRMSNQHSNIPTRTFYTAVGSEILGLGRTTSSKEKFQKWMTTLLIGMQREGRKNRQLKGLSNKLSSKYFETLKRFEDTAKSFIYYLDCFNRGLRVQLIFLLLFFNFYFF